ncbi:MAG TPA: COX15/CtaA family protein [Blastocatellia bacterium]|nr:COX15/CtaA family protein [Blastocatellia bacterium]
MKLSRFAKYAWGVLAFNLIVILWGAYVRASSSGAGCGSHWPLCNGEIIPRSPTIKTVIEFSHRLSSGLALLLTVGLLVWALRALAPKHPARRYAALSMFFMLTEAAVGAGLVLFEYVAENKSIARAWWMSGHLINTFLMVAMLTLTAWTASIETSVDAIESKRQKSLNWILLMAIVGTLILGVSGAITALGGTLFPVTSLAEGLKLDLSPTSHMLIRLRFYHPFIAVGVGALLIATAALAHTWRSGNANGDWIKKLSTAMIVLVLAQLGAGLVNLLMHAPIWLQIVHLLLSDLLWIVLVLLTFTARSQSAREASFTTNPIPAN